ncbi:hypothetical protein BDW72DRAFT_214185 [Aspergillus terricola var. indicus]
MTTISSFKSTNAQVDVGKAKAQVVVEELGTTSPDKPPVADDFMYDFKYNHALPTSDLLGTNIPASCNASQEAESIVASLSEAMATENAPTFANMFWEYGVWRDRLSFTWDYRTFNFQPAILKAATDLFPTLQFVVSFETDLVLASGVINSVLTKDGWKIYTMHTVAEKLKRYPELSPADGHMTGPVSWERQRAQDIDAADSEILIVGGGQNGLALAARCKALGMNPLIIERNESVGDVWKKRYEYLSLHFPHWADDLPYFPYPKHWPTYTPAQKQGLYMEWYASALELNIWTSSEVVRAEQDEDDKHKWTVVINKEGKETRTLHPSHVVMATSLCGVPMAPQIPGMGEFQGVLRHSTAHDSSRDFVGKKVCVVGTSSSGFDTAFDCSRRGIDVTLLQRSPTYIMSLTHSVPRAIGSYAPDADGNRPSLEEQDRLFFATPTGPGEELARRNAKVLEDLDRPLLDALHARGLRTWRGQRKTGNPTLGQTRNGGFYFTPTKVESGYIERFAENKVILNGGREREFDLVIADQCGPIWGIDEEGEFRTAYRETGVPNLWLMVGYLPYTRFHSKLLAMRLKALREKISLAPYKD